MSPHIILIGSRCTFDLSEFHPFPSALSPPVSRICAPSPSTELCEITIITACLKNLALLQPIDQGSRCIAHQPKRKDSSQSHATWQQPFYTALYFGSPSQAAAAGGGARSSGRKKIKARGSWCATWREIEFRAADPVQWEEAPMKSRMQDLSLHFPIFRLFFVPSALSKYFLEIFS